MTFARTPYQACPLCTCPARELIKTAPCDKHPSWSDKLPATIEWLRCSGCGHEYTSGYFEGEALDELLSRTQESQTPGYQIEQGRLVAADIVERVINATGIEPELDGTWLDVGVGAGHLLTTAAEYGFNTVGLDLREDTARTLNGLGYRVFVAPLEEFHPVGRLGVISMADVLEHVPFPRQTLTKAHSRLRDGGALFVSMPNTDSFVWRALDAVDRNPYWGELEHYHNFSRTRLYTLLSEHGFEPVSYGVSRRYRACMEVIATKRGDA